MKKLAICMAGVALAAVASARAGDDTGLTTRPVRAALEARRVEVRNERYCMGADGLYRYALETYEGTSAGDESLTGRFVLEIEAFDNVTQGFQGLATGRARIYDPATGRLKVRAQVWAVDSPSPDPLGVKVDGFVAGRLLPERREDPDGRARDRFFANFSVRLDTSAAFVGNLGGDVPVPPRNTAVVQGLPGACLPSEP